MRRRPPAWGFGNSQRAGFVANSCPGPGQYNPEKKSGTPAWRSVSYQASFCPDLRFPAYSALLNGLIASDHFARAVPICSFGGEAKMRGQVAGRDTPAPGTYTLGTTVGQGIK